MRAWWPVLVVALLVGCTSPDDPAHSERPDWQAGYAWSYVYDDRHVTAESQDGVWDNVTDHEIGRRIVEVINTTGRIVMIQLQDTDDGQERDIRVVRSKDLAPLDASYRGFQERCSRGQCTLEPGRLQVDPDAPRFLDFPLESGKTWRTVSDTHVTQGVVESGALVETRVGTVKAARVLLETIPLDPAAEARALREEGERNGFTIDHAEVEDVVTMLLYYSDEYKAVVQSEVRIVYSLEVTGQDAEGRPFSFVARDDRIVRENLDGARLVARPERPIDDLARYLTGRMDIRDPAGQAVSSGYDLAIEGTNATVNAALGPHLVFDAVIKGTFPADDVLAWRLVDADGNMLQQAQGPRFDLNLSLPGRLTVELEAQRGGDVIAAAGLPLVADWRTNITRECGAASIQGQPGPCPIVFVPVHTGVQALRLRVVPSGPAADGGGVLWLEDASGARIAGQAREGGYDVQLDDFGPYTVDATAWRLEYRPHAGLATTIDVEMDVRYTDS